MLQLASLRIESVGPTNQEYGVKLVLAYRVVADLGASDLVLAHRVQAKDLWPFQKLNQRLGQVVGKGLSQPIGSVQLWSV